MPNPARILIVPVDQNVMTQNTTKYTSRLAAILTLIGVAVGLGNVWRFPYMMGKYGGSAFFAVYLGFMLLFAVPALMAEIALGREGGGGILAAFRKALGDRAGSAVAVLLMTTLLVASSYYAVVVGNVIYTTAFSFLYGFSKESIPVYQAQLSNGWLQYGTTLLLVSTALFVVYKGLKNGIELVSKIVVPFFGLVIIYLIVNALLLPGAASKLSEFLRPDFSLMTSEHIFAALGQSFFSVGLGGTFMVAYGSYLNRGTSIPKMAVATSVGDLGASLLTSLFLVPTILVMGLDIASGPGLIFATLPEMFSQMPMGRVVGSLFLTALSAIAFLSVVAAYEVIAGGVQGGLIKNATRKQIVVALGLSMAILALPTSHFPKLIGILDLVLGSGMQVFGSALAVLGITWGLGRRKLLDQIFADEAAGFQTFTYYWLKWVVPFVLLSVLIGDIYSVIP